MIDRRTVVCLGLSQLVSWGITYYLIAGFAGPIAAELGWSRDLVFGGFSAALLVMGLTSPLTGRLIDRHGGRRVMAAGSLVNAAGCAGLATAHDVLPYYAAWLLLGLGMRLTLYDAAFAALVRVGGPAARRPISLITLPGGLASTVFWPVGFLLGEQFGWRGALFCYAGMALMTVPLQLAVPDGRYSAETTSQAGLVHLPRAVGPSDRRLAGTLVAVIVSATAFLNSGMSAHMIGILGGLGLAAAAAVWISALRGLGQSSARLAEIVFGRRMDAVRLNLLASLLLPVSFALGLWSGGVIEAALAFALLYGAGNGLLTITRGALPLVLFDHRTYGAVSGRLLAPGFLLSAAAPLAYASLIERFGGGAALAVSMGLALLIVGAGIVLELRFGRGR